MARTLVPTLEVTPAKATLPTALTGTHNDLVFTAKRGGAWGNSITIEYVDPGTPDETLTVDVDGYAITVTLATNGSSVITSDANSVAAKIASDRYASQLVNVALAASNDGTGLVDALSATALTGGEYGATEAAGTNADATADHYLTGNNGDTELEVVNTSGGSITVTVHYAALASVPGEPEVVTVPNNTTKQLGPFAPSLFNQNADGDVYFDPSVTSISVKFKARKVTRAG